MLLLEVIYQVKHCAKLEFLFTLFPVAKLTQGILSLIMTAPQLITSRRLPSLCSVSLVQRLGTRFISIAMQLFA